MKHEEKKEYCMPEMTVLEFVQEGNLLCDSPGDPSCSAVLARQASCGAAHTAVSEF